MMPTPRPVAPSPLAARLGRLVALHTGDRARLDRGLEGRRRWAARREMMAEGDPIHEPCTLVSGWAFRQRILHDGSRQILGLILPGDLMGVCRHDRPLAATSVVAVTDVVTSRVPAAEPGSIALAQGYALIAALDEQYLLAHITRLGRMNAIGRVADWLLETHDRLRAADLCADGVFAMPLTQEMLADALGLTSVHVNRTLQAMRRSELIAGKAGTISFPDRHRLERLVDYRPARVRAGDNDRA